ncbi:MAG: hypothetical protein IT437_08635 [Phycisphaerales bacterium]|nr:hypothetical protein [Phycisphaerales bacterium]
MFAKILTLIIAVGLIAGALLALRQARVQAAHDLADLRLRHTQQDHELRELRAGIARLVTPDSVRRMAQRIGPLKLIEPERAMALAQRLLRDAVETTRP